MATGEGVSEIECDDPAEQLQLFDPGNWWDPFWVGMPEFKQEDLTPMKSILVHFASTSDLEQFASTIGQRLTMNTRSIWFPPAEIGRMMNKRYRSSL